MHLQMHLKYIFYIPFCCGRNLMVYNFFWFCFLKLFFKFSYFFNLQKLPGKRYHFYAVATKRYLIFKFVFLFKIYMPLAHDRMLVAYRF